MTYVAQAAVGGKLVSLAPPAEAAAGLGLDVLDLPVGDLGPCSTTPTGDSCRGVELGGVLARCTCINLSEPETMLELKQLVTDATGMPTELVHVWTAVDEEALLAWADEASGFHLLDVQRPWRSGYVAVDELLQRSSTGWAYPTGAGVLALADAAGCLREGARGLELGPGCARFPRLAAALSRFYGVVSPNVEDGLLVHPPPFGAAGGRSPEILPGGDPAELLVRLSVPPGPGVQWTGAALVVGAVLAAVWVARSARA